MKKSVAILLCICLLLGLSACKEGGEGSSTLSMVSYSHSADILKDAKNGVIPEISFSLGYSVDALKEEFKSTIPKGSEIEDIIEKSGIRTTQLHGGNVVFCYENSKKEEGISLIAVQGDYAYDFSMGGVYTTHDVIDALKGEEYTKASGEDAEKDAFLLPVIPEDIECLTYSAGKYVLKFLFVEDHLTMVTLYDPELWNREKSQ